MSLKPEGRHMQRSASPVSSHDLLDEANAEQARAVGESIGTGIVAVVTFVSAAIARVRRAIPFRRAGTTSTYGELGLSARLTIGAIAVGLATLSAEALVVVPAKWENATRDFMTQAAATLPTQTPMVLGIDARFGAEAAEAFKVGPCTSVSPN